MTLLPTLAYPRIIPFALYISFLVFDQPLSRLMAVGGLDSRWLYACRASLVALLLAWFWRHYSELSWPPLMRLQSLLTAILVGIMVFILWVMPYPSWAMLGESTAGFDPMLGDGIDLWLVLFRVTGAALVVPLMEELFWRSYVMRWLDKADFLQFDPAKVSWRALAISASLFALEHNLWLAGLIAGIAYGWLYRRYRNLWVPVLAHAVTNGLLACWVLKTGAWQYW